MPTEHAQTKASPAKAGHRETVKVLTRRTAQLAAANESLRREIASRRSVEKSLLAGEAHMKRMFASSQRMQQELRQLSRRLLSVQEEERKRISRELHDVVAQALSGINLQLTLLRKRSMAGATDLRNKIDTAQSRVREAVDLVHRFAQDLRPTVLDDLGLLPAVRSQLKLVAAETGLQVKLTGPADIEDLGLEERTVLYRIFQQSLNNIVQHAKATRVAVRVKRRAGAVLMVIEDDGQGFRPHRGTEADKVSHLGLLGMRERAEMVGGTFSVSSKPGKSTRIEVTLPPKLEAGRRKKPAAKVRRGLG